jgi:hypothetical protein
MNRLRSSRRDGEPAKARRPRFFWLGLAVFLLSCVAALVATAPLTLLRVPAQALPPGVTLTPVAGTLWHGRWVLSRPQVPSVQVTTHLQLSSLLALKPAWQVYLQSAGLTAAARVALGRQTIRLTNVTAEISARSPLVRLLTAWPLGGTLNLKGDAELHAAPNGWSLTQAAGEAAWQNAQVTTTAPLALGDIQATARIDHAQFSLNLTPKASATAPLKGALDITGSWPIQTAPAIRGSLQATAQASRALTEQLRLLGRPDTSGAILIQGVLPGRY